MSSDPMRADHRLLRRLYSSTVGGKVEEVPSELDMIGRVFGKLGGSWERAFHGAPRDISLLKKIIRKAFKKGMLTKR